MSERALAAAGHPVAAKRNGETVVTTFDRLYPEHKLREQGKPARDLDARRGLDYLAEEEYRAMLKHGETVAAHRRRVALDIRTQGQRAVEWYAATSPDYLPDQHLVPVQVRALPRRGHVGGRVRPAARRRSCSSRAGPSGDPDLPDEPSRHRPPALEGVAA